MNRNIFSFRVKLLVFVIHFGIACGIVILLFCTYSMYNTERQNISSYYGILKRLPSLKQQQTLIKGEYNIWLIFTKVGLESPLKYKFHNLILNLLNVSSVSLKFHVIVDNSSRQIALSQFDNIYKEINQHVVYVFYDITYVTKKIGDIVTTLTSHFSSKPGTYYSYALFYISLGLYRIAPPTQNRAIMLDCDLYFKEDSLLLFKEFAKFKETALFGLAPELTPVYRHVLHAYRSKHNTTFGDYYHSRNFSVNEHPRGFQGYNSGVVLMNLNRIRKSKKYQEILKETAVNNLTDKYRFKGHLSDQDFYTLIGFEYPELIQTLNCGFNRQLCLWWKNHGYNDVFDKYFRCKHKIIVLHGNCNTRIPK